MGGTKATSGDRPAKGGPLLAVLGLTVLAILTLGGVASGVSRAYEPFAATVVSSNAGIVLVEAADGDRVDATDPFGDLRAGETVTVERDSATLGGKPVRAVYSVTARGE